MFCSDEHLNCTDNTKSDSDQNFVNADATENITNVVSIFASQIISLNISATCNKKILDYTSELVYTILDITKFKVLENCTGIGEVNVQFLCELLSEFKREFTQINSAYKLKKLAKGKTVQPKEIAVGNRLEKMFDSRSVISTFMYVL